eukprot:TRINITY_DN1438_c0_g1_i1.p1 TRINITY_DN1438_c0_g1~~TRINITY_DN1438_c0_g1_i1.p1  ORF type:complete len:815 (-),score=167.19 TRINITY_DN1438_c0_g1_i1:5681-8125(-)
MRLHAAAVLLALVASLATCARVFPPSTLLSPPRLRAFARQATQDDLNRVPPAFNINSGGPAVGRFVADDPAWLVGTTAAFNMPDAVIGGAEPQNLPMYRSHRFGVDAATWGYDIPVAEPGTYGCTVHFAETDAASFVDGRRVFDLFLSTTQGEPSVFPDIDITAELGGAQFTVLTKTAPELVVTGILSVRVVSKVGNAIISGVTCERLGDLPDGVAPDFDQSPIIPTEAMVPTTPELTFVGNDVDVNCGGPAIGRFVQEEDSWIRGATSMFGGPEGVVIGGAEERNTPALISHRYGLEGSEWGYTIPVDNPGMYDCSLHFAETDSESFAIGARVFDVTVNGVTLSDLDVFAESGQAEFTAVVKTFADLTVTDAIVIDLKPKEGDAFVAAITCAKSAELPFAFTPQPSTTPDALGPQETVVPPNMGRETIDGATVEPIGPDTTQPEILVPQDDVAPNGGDGDTTSTEDSTTPTDDDIAPEDDETTPTEDETTETDNPDVVTPSEPETADGSASMATVTPAPAEPDETDVPAESPEPEASTMVKPQESVAPNVEPTPQIEPTPSSSPEASLEPLESLIEPPLEVDGSELLVTYTLQVTVGGGSSFTREIRDAIKRVSNEGTTGDLEWAVTDIREQVTSTRQSNPDSEYNTDLQVLYEPGRDQERSEAQYARFVNDGSMNNELSEEGFGNVRVALVQESAAAGESETSSLSRTSTIVGVIVGCVLFLMVVVALVAFYVFRRRRANADDFDAPPPTMTESEMSSVVERTETAASIEYLDDDSTFTAATSRAGENPEQMAYVKDAFGRGTDGAHGTTSL